MYIYIYIYIFSDELFAQFFVFFFVFFLFWGTPLDQSSNIDRPEKSDKKSNTPVVAISPFANPSKTKADFQAAMQTSCFPDGLVVYINSSLAKVSYCPLLLPNSENLGGLLCLTEF